VHFRDLYFIYFIECFTRRSSLIPIHFFWNDQFINLLAWVSALWIMKYLLLISRFWNWIDLFIFHNFQIIIPAVFGSLIQDFNFYLSISIFLLSLFVTESQKLIRLIYLELEFYLTIIVNHHFFKISFTNHLLQSLIY